MLSASKREHKDEFFVYQSPEPPSLQFQARNVPVTNIVLLNDNNDVHEDFSLEEARQDPYQDDNFSILVREQQKNKFGEARGDLAVAIPLGFEDTTNLRNRIEARTEEPGEKAIQSVNELFEIYNAPLINPGLWTLNTAVNGGFRITLSKTQKLARFEIDGDFAENLGLLPVMKCPALGLKDEPTNKTVYIFVELSQADPENSAVDEVFSDFSSYSYEGQLDEFRMEDGDQLVPIPSGRTLAELRGEILVRNTDNKLFRLLDKIQVRHRGKKQYIRTKQAYVKKEADGKTTWCFEDPPLGAYVENNRRVSPTTFSLFEGIIVECPDLPFQSQEATYASTGQRSLLELRFPVEANQVSDLTGQITATEMPLIGDLLWNRTSHHQYLPVSSIGNIYQLSARASLVYRDAAGRSPLPIFLPPGGIFQLKILLLETK